MFSSSFKPPAKGSGRNMRGSRPELPRIMTDTMIAESDRRASNHAQADIPASSLLSHHPPSPSFGPIGWRRQGHPETVERHPPPSSLPASPERGFEEQGPPVSRRQQGPQRRPATASKVTEPSAYELTVATRQRTGRLSEGEGPKIPQQLGIEVAASDVGIRMPQRNVMSYLKGESTSLQPTYEEILLSSAKTVSGTATATSLPNTQEASSPAHGQEARSRDPMRADREGLFQRPGQHHQMTDEDSSRNQPGHIAPNSTGVQIYSMPRRPGTPGRSALVRPYARGNEQAAASSSRSAPTTPFQDEEILAANWAAQVTGLPPPAAQRALFQEPATATTTSTGANIERWNPTASGFQQPQMRRPQPMEIKSALWRHPRDTTGPARTMSMKHSADLVRLKPTGESRRGICQALSDADVVFASWGERPPLVSHPARTASMALDVSHLLPECEEKDAQAHTTALSLMQTSVSGGQGTVSSSQNAQAPGHRTSGLDGTERVVPAAGQVLNETVGDIKSCLESAEKNAPLQSAPGRTAEQAIVLMEDKGLSAADAPAPQPSITAETAHPYIQLKSSAISSSTPPTAAPAGTAVNAEDSSSGGWQVTLKRGLSRKLMPIVKAFEEAAKSSSEENEEKARALRKAMEKSAQPGSTGSICVEVSEESTAARGAGSDRLLADMSPNTVFRGAAGHLRESVQSGEKFSKPFMVMSSAYSRQTLPRDSFLGDGTGSPRVSWSEQQRLLGPGNNGAGSGGGYDWTQHPEVTSLAGHVGRRFSSRVSSRASQQHEGPPSFSMPAAVPPLRNLQPGVPRTISSSIDGLLQSSDRPRGTDLANQLLQNRPLDPEQRQRDELWSLAFSDLMQMVMEERASYKSQLEFYRRKSLATSPAEELGNFEMLSKHLATVQEEAPGSAGTPEGTGEEKQTAQQQRAPSVKQRQSHSSVDMERMQTEPDNIPSASTVSVSAKDQELMRLREKCSGLEQTVARLSGSLDAKTSELQAMWDAYEATSSASKQAEEALAMAEGRIRELQEEIEAVKKAAQEQALLALSPGSDLRTPPITPRKSSSLVPDFVVNDLKEEVMEKTTEINYLQSAKVTLTGQLKEQKVSVSMLRREMEELRKERDDLQIQVEDLEHGKKGHDDQIKKLEVDVQEARTEREDWRNKYLQVAEENQKKEKEMRKEKEAQHEALLGLRGEKEKLEEEIQQMTTKHGRAVKTLQEQVAGLKLKVNQVEEEIEEKALLLQGREREILDMKHQVLMGSKELDPLRSRLEALQGLLDEKRNVVKLISDELEAAKLQTRAREDDLKVLKSKYEKGQAKWKRDEEALAILRSQVDEKEEAIKELHSSLRSTLEKEALCRSEMIKLERQVQDANEENMRKDERILTLESQMGSTDNFMPQDAAMPSSPWQQSLGSAW